MSDDVSHAELLGVEFERNLHVARHVSSMPLAARREALQVARLLRRRGLHNALLPKAGGATLGEFCVVEMLTTKVPKESFLQSLDALQHKREAEG